MPRLRWERGAGMKLRLVGAREPPELKVGLEGDLAFRTRPDAGGLAHHGPARLVDAHEGVFLFVDLETGIEVCLHTDEIVRFVSRDGAS